MSVIDSAEPESASSESSSDSPPLNPARANRRVGKPKSALGKAGKSVQMLIRRIHLYSGIFMFPFVLLYGFTGWFFNHPSLFTGDQVQTFTASQIPSSALQSLPTAAELAESIVEQMQVDGGPMLQLDNDRAPRLDGYLQYEVNADDGLHKLVIHPVTGDGEVRTTWKSSSDDDEKPNPLGESGQIQPNRNVVQQVRSELPTILETIGLKSSDTIKGKRQSRLIFSVLVDGVPCIVTYELGSGKWKSVRDDDRVPMATKSFLQRLHLARRYAPGWDIRWLWALMVDAMFVSMVFWGTSGLIMWWQLKRTRLVGGMVLFASIAFAATMGIKMHDSLTAGGSRGGHPPSQPATETPETAEKPLATVIGSRSVIGSHSLGSRLASSPDKIEMVASLHSWRG